MELSKQLWVALWIVDHGLAAPLLSSLLFTKWRNKKFEGAEKSAQEEVHHKGNAASDTKWLHVLDITWLLPDSISENSMMFIHVYIV